ncbi:MAG TPA: division plane positioning ATPase MipZ [Pseudolabrys sp.]|nr:division plane positioning ATPase MipZ [Pseudolabrys sp.]
MFSEGSVSAGSVRVIVVANEKGGSGKSTVAMHLAVALMKSGASVATVDLDTRQRSFTHYIDNRLAWSRDICVSLPTPDHVCFDEEAEFADDLPGSRAALADTIENLAASHGFIVIDTPGHNHELTRYAHERADTLITPLNDSFVDLDVLAAVEPRTFTVAGVSHYAGIVEAARRARQLAGKSDTDWVVLRNRLSTLSSRNKRFVGNALADLSRQLGFRCIEGLAERVIFREFYPRGLTAVDTLDAETLGTRPSLSHATAQLEVQGLVAALLPMVASQTAPSQSHAA